jgi:peptide deformylase
MTLPPIVQVGAPVLRARAREVRPEDIATAPLQALFATMTDAMREAPGVGLAAPQIDVPLRVIVLEDREDLMARLTLDERRERSRVPFDLRILVNPF